MGSADHYGEDSSMDGGACSGVGAVADPPGAALALESSLLCSLDSLDDLARWRDEVINLHRRVILGTSAVPDVASCGRNRDGSRVAHPVAISTLEALLAGGIDRMRENGELAVDADPARLAMGVTAALQGGSLLAKTSRDIALLEVALDLALSYVRSHSPR
jgi:TetR/AcrR family transcriptional repressor of nem operon